MTNHTLFREIPPWITVLQVLSMLKLSTEPPFVFQKHDICLDQSLEVAHILEPYYIPCKARQFLDYTTQNRWITILRHLFLPHGYCIVSQETTRDKKKAIFYKVERAQGFLREPIKIDFS